MGLRPSNNSSTRGKPWVISSALATPPVDVYKRQVYLQGELADSFFYLKKGRVKIFLTSENGMEKTLSLLEPGNIFGEAAFFDGMPRVSSAKAICPCEIVRITRGDLLQDFTKEPELAMSLLTLLSHTCLLYTSSTGGKVSLTLIIPWPKGSPRLTPEFIGRISPGGWSC